MKIIDSRESGENLIEKVVGRLVPLRRRLKEDGMTGIDSRRALIGEMRQVLSLAGADESTSAGLILHLYVGWLEEFILRSANCAQTLNTYAPTVEKLLAGLPTGKPLHEMSVEEATEAFRQVLDTYRNSVRTALNRFREFLARRVGSPFDKISWKAPALRKKKQHTRKTFVIPSRLDRILAGAEDFYRQLAMRSRKKDVRDDISRTEHTAKTVRLVCLLAYYCGLRISEILQLRCRHVKPSDGFYLQIWKSKTKNGRRNVPLRLLMPVAAYEEFLAHYRSRRDSAGNGAFLFVRHDGKPWGRSNLGSLVAKLFKSSGLEAFRFHDLRHGAANILLLRGFAAYNRGMIPWDAAIFRHEIFNEENALRMRELLRGPANTNEEAPVLHVVQTVSKILGHGGPKVSTEEYLHVVDLVFHLITRSREQQMVEMSTRQIMDFLQVRYERLPPDLRGNTPKVMTGAQLLQMQRDLLAGRPLRSPGTA